MRISHWMVVAAFIAPLFACSSSDDGGSDTDGGTGGSVVGGSGGGVVGGSGGGETGGTGGGVTGGTGGGVTGGTGGGVTGGSGGGTSECPAGTTQIDNGGECLCVIPCTAGDDSPCQGQGHCCDFSSAGAGFLCGVDSQATCDSVLASTCGGGGSSGFDCGALTGGSVPECDTCAASSCTSQCTACGANPDCMSMAQCAYQCTDSACVQNCASQFPNGAADYDAFLGQPSGCLISNCQSTCFSG